MLFRSVSQSRYIATGKENQIRIEGGSQLSKEEIERMKAEAEANAEADAKEREMVDKLNAADSIIFQTEKQLKEYGDKLSADKKAPIETALAKLKDAHQSRNMAGIESAMNEINAAWQAASEEMYKAAQEQQPSADAGASQQANPSGNAGDVTDVDFEEVKDDKK